MLSLQRRAWKLLSPKLRLKVAMVFLCTLLISALEVLGISLILPILGLLVEPQTLYQQNWLHEIYILSGQSSSNDFIRLLLFAMAIAIITKNLSAIVINRWQIGFLNSAAADVSKRFFETYLRMPFAGTSKRDTGFFAYTVNSLSGIFYGMVVQQSIIALGEVTTITLLAIALFIANPVVTFVAVGILVISGGMIYLLTASKLKQIGVVQRRALQRSVRLIKEAFTAFKEIRVSGRVRFFDKAYSQNMDELTASLIGQARTVMLTRYLIEIVVTTTIVVVAFLMLQTDTTSAAIGQLSLFGVATLRIMPSISRIVSAMQALKTTEAPMDLFEQEIAEMQTWALEDAGDFALVDTNAPCEPIDIELVGVEFAYDVGSDHVVNKVDLKIPFGVVLGMAGPSGAGKTTLADLILGVITPTKGQVLYNGAKFIENSKHWRQKVAYVPQKIAFLERPLRDNVAFGVEAEKIDDARVLHCLEMAQLIDKLDELPDGLHSYLGEDGKFLSGGEKQRLGIARALYMNASLLVFDEATSALDAETEERLSQVIHSLSGKRTVLIIAHRLATLQTCDQVVFMEDGRLETGKSFSGLYQSNTRFRNMVDLSRIDPAQRLN